MKYHFLQTTPIPCQLIVQAIMQAQDQGWEYVDSVYAALSVKKFDLQMKAQAPIPAYSIIFRYPRSFETNGIEDPPKLSLDLKG